jgi:hypothetical protein
LILLDHKPASVNLNGSGLPIPSNGLSSIKIIEPSDAIYSGVIHMESMLIRY